MKISRRRLIEAAGVAALATPAASGATMPEPKFEGKDTPKLCLSIGDGGGGFGGGGRRGAAEAPATPPAAAPPPAGTPPLTPEAASARRLKQIGIDWVLS